MDFEVFFKICSTCFYFAVLTQKVVPLIPLHFLSNMSSQKTSPYIFIMTPFGPCASNIFGDPCNALMLQFHHTNLSLNMYHHLKHVDFPLLYHIFLQFHQFLYKLFSTYQLIWCTHFVSLILTFQHKLPTFVITFYEGRLNTIFFLNNIFTSCGELKMLIRSKKFMY